MKKIILVTCALLAATSSMFAAILGITAYPFFEAEEAARNSINASDYFYKK